MSVEWLVDRELPFSSSRVDIPPEVERAMSVDWGVMVDAFLVNAAKMGGQYAASVFCDRSGRVADGMTVVTPEVLPAAHKDGMTLLRSASGHDHYVIASPFSVDQPKLRKP